VHVKHVELHCSHGVQKQDDVRQRDKVPSDIEKHATMTQERFVDDKSNARFKFGRVREQLLKRGQRPRQTNSGVAGDDYAVA
jgi:hypothetical protein